jgi:hypothetical protein
VIGALAVSKASDRLAVAAAQRLGFFELSVSPKGARLGECLWDTPLEFHCQWLHFDAAHRLWAGGFWPPASDASIDDWNACVGGGVQAFAIESGRRQFTSVLPEATAWGYGADPLVLSDDSRSLYALGRDASLQVIDVMTGATTRLCDPPEAMDTRASLGIGHAAVRDGWLYAGFSRGGFLLIRYDLRSS